MPQNLQPGTAESDGNIAFKERLCPECEGKLVPRKSKFGPFLGCANYPKCKHIAKD